MRATQYTVRQITEAALLDHLEEHFYRLTGREFDRQLSLEILHDLRPLLENEQGKPFLVEFDEFIGRHRDKIEGIFERYAEDDRNLLLFQPESLLVFDLLERDPFKLEEVWKRSLPMDLLEQLTTVWGRPITLAA